MMELLTSSMQRRSILDALLIVRVKVVTYDLAVFDVRKKLETRSDATK